MSAGFMSVYMRAIVFVCLFVCLFVCCLYVLCVKRINGRQLRYVNLNGCYARKHLNFFVV